MKKIGILTFHNGKNFGASLQCYALKTTLESIFNGYRVEVINFQKPRVFGEKHKISKNLLARKIYEFFFKKSIKTSDIKFDEFMKNNLGISEDIVNEDNISEKTKEYEMIFFGSDQIWNMNEKIYDRSKVFFGDFEFKGKKYSYAASFGDSIKDVENNRDYIIEKLKLFDKISVREENGKKFLNDNSINADWVVDPTLLLDKTEWEKIISKERVIKDKYILYYSVNCRKYSWKIAQKLSKQTGLKVINLVPHPKILASGFKNFYSGGPIEFLNLMKNADYVVTNSFHGTIFSIIFNKKFIPAFDMENNKLKIEERKYSLLSALEINSICKTVESDIDITTLDDIYTEKLENNLNRIKQDSLSFLKEIKGE